MAREAFSAAVGMRHQGIEVSVVPAFPFDFLLRPQRALVEPLIVDSSMRQRPGPLPVSRVAGVTPVGSEVCLLRNKLPALHPHVSLVQWLELFLVADYRSSFPSSPSRSHEPITALNLSVCVCVRKKVHFSSYSNMFSISYKEKMPPRSSETMSGFLRKWEFLLEDASEHQQWQ